jgi:hypothetical protein
LWLSLDGILDGIEMWLSLDRRRLEFASGFRVIWGVFVKPTVLPLRGQLKLSKTASQFCLWILSFGEANKETRRLGESLFAKRGVPTAGQSNCQLQAKAIANNKSKKSQRLSSLAFSIESTIPRANN